MVLSTSLSGIFADLSSSNVFLGSAWLSSSHLPFFPWIAIFVSIFFVLLDKAAWSIQAHFGSRSETIMMSYLLSSPLTDFLILLEVWHGSGHAPFPGTSVFGYTGSKFWRNVCRVSINQCWSRWNGSFHALFQSFGCQNCRPLELKKACISETLLVCVKLLTVLKKSTIQPLDSIRLLKNMSRISPRNLFSLLWNIDEWKRAGFTALLWKLLLNMMRTGRFSVLLVQNRTSFNWDVTRSIAPPWWPLTIL